MRGTPLETTQWRLSPVAQPESSLIGVAYSTWLFRSWETSPGDTWIVANARAWPYEGTGVHEGDKISGIVGYEIDHTDQGTSPGTVILSSSPVVDVLGRANLQQGAVRDVESGAFVFAAGTIEWSWGLSKPGIADARVQRITENVFRRAGLDPQ